MRASICKFRGESIRAPRASQRPGPAPAAGFGNRERDPPALVSGAGGEPRKASRNLIVCPPSAAMGTHSCDALVNVPDTLLESGGVETVIDSHPARPSAGQRRSGGRSGGRVRLAVALATGALCGCVSAAPYRELAAAGATCSKTVVSLTRAAEALAIDASSERLLQDDALANADHETLRRFDAEDAARGAVLDRLAGHARLTGRYFTLLGGLVDGAPGRATLAALDAAADALDEAGAALRGTAPAGEVRAARSAGAATLGFHGRALARREVETRAAVIERELATQGEVVATIGAAMRHDAEIVAAARAHRLVVEPLLAEAPVADADGWIAERRARSARATAGAELAAAKRAVENLRAAVAAVAARQPALDRLEEVAADAEAVRAALAALGLGKELP